jgi:signal transduction histidine kinase
MTGDGLGRQRGRGAVRDDGAGGADASRGSGLTGLRDRVEAVVGGVTVDSPAGAGTVLTVPLPVTADNH